MTCVATALKETHGAQRKGTFGLALEGFPEKTITELRNERKVYMNKTQIKGLVAAHPNSTVCAKVVCLGWDPGIV